MKKSTLVLLSYILCWRPDLLRWRSCWSSTSGSAAGSVPSTGNVRFRSVVATIDVPFKWRTNNRKARPINVTTKKLGNDNYVNTQKTQKSWKEHQHYLSTQLTLCWIVQEVKLRNRYSGKEKPILVDFMWETTST